MDIKINTIAVERKFNLGNFQMLTIKVDISPEPIEENQNIEKLIKEVNKKIEIAKEKITEGDKK